MTDNEIIKAETLTSGEINKNKIKAIYPHIVVHNSAYRPYYGIQWYDIEKQTMVDGFGSYELKFVLNWLQEEFEVIDENIGSLINRQKAKIEALQMDNKQLETDNFNANMNCEHLQAEIERLTNIVDDGAEVCHNCHSKYAEKIKQAKADAIKAFAERLKEYKIDIDVSFGYGREVYTEAVAVIEIDNLVKEMVGDKE